MRGTVSTLCANTSGAAANRWPSRSRLPEKSGASISTPVSGLSRWIWRMVSAYSQAPSSARSSRQTPVTVAYRSCIFCTDSATRLGSPASKSAGLPVSIWQKSQRRVHWSPPIRKVASRSSQHSKMLGQPASWHTVCRSSDFTSDCSARYSGPIRAVVLIQDGFFSMGTLALRTSRRNSLRPSGAMVTESAYLGTAPGRLTAKAGPKFPRYTRETDTEPGKLRRRSDSFPGVPGKLHRVWCSQHAADSAHVAAAEDHRGAYDDHREQHGPVGEAVAEAHRSLHVVDAHPVRPDRTDGQEVLMAALHHGGQVSLGRPGGKALGPGRLAQDRVTDEPDEEVAEQRPDRRRGVPADRADAETQNAERHRHQDAAAEHAQLRPHPRHRKVVRARQDQRRGEGEARRHRTDQRAEGGHGDQLAREHPTAPRDKAEPVGDGAAAVLSADEAAGHHQRGQGGQVDRHLQ